MDVVQSSHKGLFRENQNPVALAVVSNISIAHITYVVSLNNQELEKQDVSFGAVPKQSFYLKLDTNHPSISELHEFLIKIFGYFTDPSNPLTVYDGKITDSFSKWLYFSSTMTMIRCWAGEGARKV